MQVLAVIFNYKDGLKEPIHSIELKYMPSSENVIEVDDGFEKHRYKVCETLHSSYNANDRYYNFEQILIKRNKVTGDYLRPKEYFILKGEVVFDIAENEFNRQNVTLVNDGNSLEKIAEIKVLYPYIRKLDFIRLNDSAYRITDIILSDKIEVIYTKHSAPITTDQFYSWALHFCRDRI